MYEKKINARVRERRSFAVNLQLKEVDAKGRFAGYASVFNVIDNQRDVVVRGAFSRTLKGRIDDIKLLWQHQQEEPIGTFDRMFEDKRGLYVEGALLLNIRRAQEAHTLMRAKAVSGLSIGYSPVVYNTNPETGVRKLSDIDLWEVSLVTFPANSSATVTVVKQAWPILKQYEAQKMGRGLREQY